MLSLTASNSPNVHLKLLASRDRDSRPINQLASFRGSSLLLQLHANQHVIICHLDNIRPIFVKTHCLKNHGPNQDLTDRCLLSSRLVLRASMSTPFQQGFSM